MSTRFVRTKSESLALLGLSLALLSASCSLPPLLPPAQDEMTALNNVVQAEQPNILLILTDDQRWDAVGYSGNEVLKTPHLDRLAEQGMRLDRFYVASPVCHFSRGTMLTGRYYSEGALTQRRGRGLWNIRSGLPTVASHLSEAGYATGFIGKSHLARNPRTWGFQEVPVMLPKDPWGGSKHIDPELVVAGVKTTVKGHITQILADAALGFIDKHQREPWFLWLATSAPHVPYHAFPDYPYDYRSIQQNPPPGWPPGKPLPVGKGVYDWAAYYSTISMLDEQIGRVLEQLDQLGLAENTLVVFVSDNGIQLGSHAHMGKGIWYEESSRVPAVVRWPGKIQAGSVSQAPVSAVDVLPTLLDVVGLEAPAGLESKSMLPLLRGGAALREYAFCESRLGKNQGEGFWQMIVGRRWKYVEFTGRAGQHLYDLENDPHELENLIASPQQAGVMKQMKTKLAQWRQLARRRSGSAGH